MATPLSPRGAGPAAGEVWLYEKKGFQGAVFKIRGSIANIQEKYGAPEYLGSLKLGHDSFVEVFNHTGYKGKSARFESDHDNILKEHDHKIASVRAYEKGKEPPPASPRGGEKH